MLEVRSSEAKAHLAQLLDEVERGETVVITRHGRAIARIVPEIDGRKAEIVQAIETLKTLRKRIQPIPLSELLASRHDGHRY